MLGLATSHAAELAELVSGITSGAGVFVPIGEEWVDVEPRWAPFAERWTRLG